MIKRSLIFLLFCTTALLCVDQKKDDGAHYSEFSPLQLLGASALIGLGGYAGYKIFKKNTAKKPTPDQYPVKNIMLSEASQQKKPDPLVPETQETALNTVTPRTNAQSFASTTKTTPTEETYNSAKDATNLEPSQQSDPLVPETQETSPNTVTPRTNTQPSLSIETTTPPEDPHAYTVEVIKKLQNATNLKKGDLGSFSLEKIVPINDLPLSQEQKEAIILQIMANLSRDRAGGFIREHTQIIETGYHGDEQSYGFDLLAQLLRKMKFFISINTPFSTRNILNPSPHPLEAKTLLTPLGALMEKPHRRTPWKLYKKLLALGASVEENAPQDLKRILVKINNTAYKTPSINELVKNIQNYEEKRRDVLYKKQSMRKHPSDIRFEFDL